MDGHFTELIRGDLQRELGKSFCQVASAVQSGFDFDFALKTSQLFPEGAQDTSGSPVETPPRCKLKGTETDGLASLEKLLPDNLVGRINIPAIGKTIRAKRQALAYVLSLTNLAPRVT